MEKSVIIIGAGIAGLSAGCYGQMNGYRTSIFEMHDKPGGLCTSWKRKDYTIDGCLEWLVGSEPGNSFYRIWQELGAIQGRQMINHEHFGHIEGRDGGVLILYTDVNRLEEHLKELAPEDKDVIEEFTKGVRKCTRIDMPIDKAPELYGLVDKFTFLFKMLPHLMFMRKWKKLPIVDFAERFRNPLLRDSFRALGSLPELPMLAGFMTFAWQHQKVGGYAVGGSLEFARAIERRYLDLGGEIHYKSPVTKVLVANNEALGVRLADGTEHRSDVVISAADGHTTIFDMLEGRYINNKVQGYYDELPLFPPLTFVTLGVARSFEGIPHALTYHLDEPIEIGGLEQKLLTMRTYSFDPTLAPPGKNVVKVQFLSDYEYWKDLKENPARYKDEKERVANKVVELLDRRFPGLAVKVEMRDVATPMTWVRYTGNWKGSFEGWLPTTKTLGMRMSKTLPGLKNFYMVGQWVEPGGGLPPAALSGRNVTQILCKKDKIPFVTTIPSP